jgi:hypothetical protein
MTVQEIHNELFADVKSLGNRMTHYREDFRRKVLKCSHFPYNYPYEYLTSSNNPLIITFTALKRSNHKKPIISIFGIYNRREGKYAAALTIDMNITSIYPPHFFKRYRERIVKDNSIPNDALIKLYFENDWGFVGAVVDENFKAVYHCFEDDNKDNKIDFVCANSQGYCFGEKQGNINIIKTIVSEDMLHDNQKPLFAELKERLIVANKERYK